MKPKDIIGHFSVIGTNQDDSRNTYTGELNLSLDKDDRIVAKWLINKSQPQNGIGVLKNNSLVINFQYQGDENTIYRGTVIYKFLTKDILEGTWTEEFGNPNYVGTENCFRVKDYILN